MPRLGVRQIAAILGRTIRSTYALTQDFDDAGLRLPGRDLFVRVVPFFEWLHSHPRLRSRGKTLADRDRRRVSRGGFLRPGPKGRSPHLVALGKSGAGGTGLSLAASQGTLANQNEI